MIDIKQSPYHIVHIKPDDNKDGYMSLQFKKVDRSDGRDAIILVVWRYDAAKKRTTPKAVHGGTVVLDGEIMKTHANPPADLLKALEEAGGGDDERGALDAWWTETHRARARERARYHGAHMIGFSLRSAIGYLAEAEQHDVLEHEALTAALADAETLVKALRRAVKATAPKPVAPAQSDAETGTEEAPADPLAPAATGAP